MNLKGKKILAIGGEGFLGKNLCKKLLNLKAQYRLILKTLQNHEIVKKSKINHKFIIIL